MLIGISLNFPAWMKQSALNWVKNENRAICLVDWRNLARTNFKITARNYTKIVASYIAEMVRVQHFVPNETIVAGHSLGAHIAGFTGKSLNGSLKRIYGNNSLVIRMTLNEYVRMNGQNFKMLQVLIPLVRNSHIQ